MALSHGMVRLGRFALILLLYLKLISICLNVVSCIVLGHWTFTVGILLILSTFTLHIVGMLSFGEAWTLGKRHYYSYTWFVYTGLLIVDIIVVLTPYLLVVDAEKDIPFWLTIFVKVLYITPFILLLFLNTAGEEGAEFHGESSLCWLWLERNDADRQECNHDMYISLGITPLLWSDFSINISGWGTTGPGEIR